MIAYVYPNLSVFNQRGNLDERKVKLDEINRQFNTNDFKVIEIPADFIKNESEENKTGLLPCSLLTGNSVSKLYKKSYIKVPYILHTEPELSRSKCSRNSIAYLNWYNSEWNKRFVNHVFSIIDFFECLPYAIEIHPGKSQRGKNNYKSFISAIKLIYEEYSKKYHKNPMILIENRTGSFIQTGTEISEFWNNLCVEEPSLKDKISIILDIQQLFTVCKKDFLIEMNKIPIESIKGFHIHRLHRSPKINDGIDWLNVSKKIKSVETKKDIILLPEVHNKNHLVETYHFCKKTLKL